MQICFIVKCKLVVKKSEIKTLANIFFTLLGDWVMLMFDLMKTLMTF